MAEAAGHRWGQFVGEYCESAIEPLLQGFADKHGLFLDKKGPRPARSGKKLQRPEKTLRTCNLLTSLFDLFGTAFFQYSAGTG